MKRGVALAVVVLGFGLASYLYLGRQVPKNSLSLPDSSQAPILEAPLAQQPASARSTGTGAPQERRLAGRAYSLALNFEALPGDAAQVVEALRLRAEAGDEVAAFDIYLKLAACRNQFDAAVAADPDTYNDSHVPEECRSIPMSQWREYTSKWLDISAARGFVPAQLAYAADPGSVIGEGRDMLSDPEAVAAYRRKAMEYLNRAASTGNVEALQKLALAHTNGILTPRNPSLAYAYMWAANEASGSLVPPELADTLLKKYAAGLSSNEVDVATRQGKTIYENCCFP